MIKTVFSYLLVMVLSLVFTASNGQDSKKQLPIQFNFSDELINNFTEKGFLKEEASFVTTHTEEVKRPAEIYRGLALSLFKKQNINAAVLVFKKAAEVHSTNEDVISTLARLYDKINNKQAAIESYKQVIEISINNKSKNEDYYKSELRRLQRREAKPGLDILFEEQEYKFSQQDRQLISKIIVDSENKIRALLPTLPKDIRIIVSIIDRNVDMVGGVTGRAETHTPGEMIVEISNVFPGGISAAVKKSLTSTIFHEFHHINRGWAIKDNKYGPGISTAMVNEGLAVVFAEIYTGEKFDGNSYTEEADNWVKEIMLLPKDANYSQWVMGEHPDGRTSIGYRAGNYLIHKTIATTGKNILQLSELSPDVILSLAGYEN